MGDKYKSDTQKAVNNPLLSGAGHGFPFDTFQGSSLLVPISQDNPSVLGDQVGEPDKFVGQDVPYTENPNRMNETLNTTGEGKNDQGTAGNQRYVGRFFNGFSFFGGGKTEQETRQEKTELQTSGSVSSTPRSYSPYVHVPNFQTITPALQVPSVTPSTDSLHGNPPAEVGVDKLNKQFESGVSLSEASSSLGDRPPPPPQLPATTATTTSISTSDSSPGFIPSNFRGPPYQFQPPPTVFPPPTSAGFPPPQHDLNPSNFTPAPMNQPYLPSEPSGTSNHDGNVSKPPLANPNAPPLFRDSTKTYRLSHNKRPVYAPIPGLTLSSSGSGTFMQSNEAAAAFQPSPYSAFTNSQPLGYSAPAPVSTPQPGGHSTSSTAISQAKILSPAGVTSGSFPVSQTYPPVGVTSQPGFSTSVTSCTQPLPYSGMATSQPGGYSTSGPPSSTLFTANPQSSASSYFNAPPSVDSFQSSIISSVSKSDQMPVSSAPEPQPVQPPIIQPSPVMQAFSSQPPLPYPTDTPNSDTQTLFAPISKANINPSESVPPVTVVNPVAIHPSGSLPTNLQPQTTKEENPSTTAIVPPSLNHLAHVGRTGIAYRPPYHHWFYKKDSELKEYWYPFSMTDSVTLEQAYQSGQSDENTLIPTDGGRYDVNIIKRKRTAVYWEETPKEVRRCSWFYKVQGERYRPYDENVAYHLEEEFKKCVTTDTWRKRVDLGSGEYLIIYSATNIAHFESNIPMPDGWEGDFADGAPSLPTPVKMVKRGISDDFDIDDGESPRVDHLVFVVHGIGSVCDLKFRTIEEAVDVFRSLSHKLSKIHFYKSMKDGLVNRIEILPISWHSHLHGETTGLDKKLESITLKSIPRLRNFTNDTLLDILFYTSPVYCQKIVEKVGHEISTIYEKFKMRNPNFSGGVSLLGHSLGSLILFDMLCHQKVPATTSEPASDSLRPESKLTRRMSGFVIGNAEALEPFVNYPQLPFHPVAFFALGSPIGMFITVRGIDSLGEDFHLPTCPRFFNIFHPFDPVAYRIEALVKPEMSRKRPILIPHHKGRKRMHLELKETITRVGADLKQRLVDSIRSTWNTVYQLTAFGRADDGLEQEVDKVIEKQIAGSESAVCLTEQESSPCDVGRLNQGRRIDFVLQEAPLESFNEYVSALRSHLIYWDSEDTVLMVLKEIYNAEGITQDVESLISQETTTNNSPQTPAPDVGWNIAGEVPSKAEGPEGQAPSYGFINN